jgi:hypothetical protein
MPREVLFRDFEPMNGLVDANVDEARFIVDLPGTRVRQLCVVGRRQVCYLDQVLSRDELAGLFDALRRPETGGHVHGFSRRPETDQILHNGCVLISSAALIQHYGVCFRHVKQPSDLELRHVGNIVEFGLTVAQLHDRLAGAAVVDHFLGALGENGVG